MKTHSKIAALRAELDSERLAGKRIAFVPTMGNLHEGHLQLIRHAHTVADVVVASIFVNPLQFGANEDLDSYPRTISADKEKLFSEGTHYLFLPEVDEIYPHGMDQQTTVTVPNLPDRLCGASRPGHFTGVTTVVTKLFQIVQPNIAVFGEKDFQQLAIIRRMTSDLCMPISIIGVPTARAEDGLALSSRNGYLSSSERETAPHLNRVLEFCRSEIANGNTNYDALEQQTADQLTQVGFKPDYVSIRDASTLDIITEETKEIAILAAAFLGSTRLIDNVTISSQQRCEQGSLAAS